MAVHAYYTAETLRIVSGAAKNKTFKQKHVRVLQRGRCILRNVEFWVHAICRKLDAECSAVCIL